MTEDKVYTSKEVAEILERQNLIFALEHAIQRGKQIGDAPRFVNPLVELYNLMTAPVPQVAPKESEES